MDGILLGSGHPDCNVWAVQHGIAECHQAGENFGLWPSIGHYKLLNMMSNITQGIECREVVVQNTVAHSADSNVACSSTVCRLLSFTDNINQYILYFTSRPPSPRQLLRSTRQLPEN